MSEKKKKSGKKSEKEMEVFTSLYSTEGYPTMYVDNASQRFHFWNPQVQMSWWAQVESLKTEAACAKEVEDRNAQLEAWRNWLERCDQFRARWTDHYIPFDVKAAINDVRKNAFNMEELNMGPNENIIHNLMTNN